MPVEAEAEFLVMEKPGFKVDVVDKGTVAFHTKRKFCDGSIDMMKVGIVNGLTIQCYAGDVLVWTMDRP